MNKQLTLGILLSGRGSNFAAIAENVMTGKLPCEIGCVISNVATAPGLERAREWGFNSYFLDSRGKERAAFDAEVMETLRAHHVDYVCLAGYMRLLSPSFVEALPNRILNIHPSLLPAFPGLHAQRQALEYGVRYSGCTVHFVDAGLDSGPVILQTIVPVLQEDDEDALSGRILKEEHRLYSEAIRLLCEGRVQVEGRRVRIL
ncbi:MAG TPA: phosphoribosylglycinamide formyltransferase [Acidobacteriota bacterium]|jgi:phosphoribosylglycinamide formyltransferase-1